ncbi:MAG TPA: hypothetical protein VFO73_15055 [Candidatus Limnocylindrales bacterium]|nr:hypothetical protein [Candidatus Limnocylindrales bacterium]
MTIFVLGLSLVACGGGSPAVTPISSPFTAPPPTVRPATPSPTASPTAGIGESDVPSSCLPLPHEAPDLEALMPATIAGRPLARESFRGALMMTCVMRGSDADVADFADALAADGMELDDISLAIAGRSDVENDPPYLIFAYRMAGHPGMDWPSTIGLEHPAAAAFEEAVLEDKHVLVGKAAAVDQSVHVRGRPYVWDSPTVHYLIVTDDEDWAREALRALH